MGGAIYMRLLGALEMVAILSIACGVGVATRRNKTRMLVGLVVTCSVLGLSVCATKRVPALKDRVYLPITSLYHLVRYGN